MPTAKKPQDAPETPQDAPETPTENPSSDSTENATPDQIATKEEARGLTSIAPGRPAIYRDFDGADRAAFVASVSPEGLVNLMVITASGTPQGRGPVTRGDGIDQWRPA